MTKQTYQIKTVPRLLELIGASMYSDSVKAIAELAVNEYDADATTVLIEIHDGKIEIAGNGHGMDNKELQEQYLMFGSAHKTDIKKTATFKRLPVGNKGIGKWAGLGIARKMEVVSAKNGKRYSLILDYDDLSKYKTLEEAKLEGTVGECDAEKHGTRIILSRLNRKTAIDKKWLMEGLARELPTDGNINYYVNGVLLQRTEIKADVEMPIYANVPDVGHVSGKLVIATKRLERGTPGILIRVRKKAVGKPLLFDIPSHFSTWIQLIAGEVEADGLNDIIKTDRSGFLENTEKWKSFYTFMSKSMLYLLKKKDLEIRRRTAIKDRIVNIEALRNIAKIFNKIQKRTEEMPKPIKVPVAAYKKRKKKIGISQQLRKTLRSKKPIGKIELRKQTFKIKVHSLGSEDKECRISEEDNLIIVNSDHPSYIYARAVKNKHYMEYQMFRAVATAYAFLNSESLSRFYELVDMYIREYIDYKRV